MREAFSEHDIFAISVIMIVVPAEIPVSVFEFVAIEALAVHRGYADLETHSLSVHGCFHFDAALVDFISSSNSRTST